MDVIIMQSTISILSSLKTNYPQFSFKQGDNFLWSSSDNTIYYDRASKNQAVFLLHELSHALLGHSSYKRDIQLITMERQAWDHTIELAPKYNVAIEDEMVQSTLDSYRDWLHARSTCPSCKATGVQINKFAYVCSACNHKWRVNEARTCDLRRYRIKK
jgi:hypothetical protein